MGLVRRISFYLLIPVVLICVLEGYIYYSSFGLSGSSVFLCTLDNVYKIFLARPSLYPYNAFRNINESYTGLEVLITRIYGVVVIIAPILTATTIITGFKAYLYDFWYSVSISFKDKMYIVGDGRRAGTIARKYASKYNVFYLMNSDTETKTRLPLLKKKVKAVAVDYKNMAVTCREARIEKASFVVINFKNWFESYSTVTDLLDYLIRHAKEKPISVSFIDAPSTFVDVFPNLYHGLCIKNGQPETALSVRFFDVSNLNAEEFFRDPQLTVQPDNVHNIVFTGLGPYGKSYLRNLVDYMSKNSLTGSVFIIDRDLENNLSDLMYSMENAKAGNIFTPVEPANLASYSVEISVPAGIITLNFYKASVGEFKFAEVLTSISAFGNITEYFLCVDNISTTMEYYRIFLNYLIDSQNTNVYFRLSENQIKGFDAIKISTPEIHCLPDRFPQIDFLE